METSSRDFDTLSTFEHGIEVGNLISGSDYIWCISSRDGELRIKNTKEKFEISSPYHDFGIASNVTNKILFFFIYKTLIESIHLKLGQVFGFIRNRL